MFYNLPAIYKILTVSKPNFKDLLDAGKIWICYLNIDENQKIYMIGDLIQLFIKYNLPLDSSTINFLENFSNANPHSAHFNFIQDFLKQKKTLSTLLFEIDAENLHNEKNEVKKCKEKIILIDFWATWCTPCIAANPNLEKIKAKYQDKVKVIKISIDESKINWERYVREKDKELKDNFIISRENFETEIKKINLESVPRYWIVNNEGKILNMAAPSPTNNALEESLVKILE